MRYKILTSHSQRVVDLVSNYKRVALINQITMASYKSAREVAVVKIDGQCEDSSEGQ